MKVTKLLWSRVVALTTLLYFAAIAASIAADVAAPVLQLEAGSTATQFNVRVTDATPNAVIRYRTDGADPTASDPTVASGGTVAVSSNVIFKAKAWDGGSPATLTPSAVATAVYNVLGRVAAGEQLSFALKFDGRLLGVGYNYNGGLGDGSYTSRYTPASVVQSAAVNDVMRNVVSIEGGQSGGTNDHTVAAKRDGTVWGWGYNGYGQLGNGGSTTSAYPVQVLKGANQPLTGAVMVAGAYYTSYALCADGTVWSWGYNAYGELGEGSTTARSYAGQVKINSTTPLTGIVAIAAGDYHFLALDNAGKVWTIGNNGYGQLGDGSATNRSYAAKVQASAGVDFSGVVSLAGSSHSSVAVKADGSVWSWGLNSYGQLGDGTATQRNYPVQMKADATNNFAGAQKVTAAYLRAMILKTDGSVWSVGYNGYGELGDGTTTARSYPIQVKKDASNYLSGIVDLAAGGNHNVALDNTGKVFTWGYAGNGQLGNGTTSSPTYAYATAYSQWPSQAYVQTQLNLAVTSTSTTDAGAFLLSATPVDPQADIARVEFYQGSTLLGTVTSGPWQLAVTGRPLNAEFSVIAYSASGLTSHVASAGPPVSTPGLSLETGATSTQFSVRVTVATPNAVIRYRTDGGEPTTSDATVASGGTVAISSNAIFKARAWDGNAPVVMAPSKVATAIYNPFGRVMTGDQETYALKFDGRLSAVGYNYTGQLGDGTATARTSPVSVLKSAAANDILRNVVWMDAGQSGSAGYYDQMIVAKADGTAWSWGYSGYGGLGYGSTATSYYPVQVMKAAGQPLTGVIMTASGYYAGYALCEDGTVWAWGYNGYGNLGDGTTADNSYARQVKTNATTPLTGIIAIAASNHLLALDNTGKVWSWGYNNYGELGDGTTTNRSYAAKVQASSGVDLSGVTSVATTYYSSTAVKGDGSVWSWGYNNYGQLGDGTATQRTYPVQVKADGSNVFAGAKSVMGGSSHHMLILKTDGTLWGVGLNDYGQLGDGTATNRSYPVQVKKTAGTYLTNVVSYSAGYSHSAALDSTGTVYTWGANGNGQLGNGSTTATSYATAPSQWPSQAYVQTSLNLAVTSTSTTDPGAFLLSATVTDLLADIARVEFYQGGVLIGTVTSGPWQLSVTGRPLNQQFTAIAYSTSGLASVTANAAGMVATPVLQLETGATSTQFNVRITDATPNAVIRYRTDGADPTVSDPSVSSGATVSIASNVVFKAKAWDGATPATLSPSAISTGIYNVLGRVAASGHQTFRTTSDGHMFFSGNDLSVYSAVTPALVNQTTASGTIDHFHNVAYVSGGVNSTTVLAPRNHLIAVRTDGTVWAWGNGQYGQLGNGLQGDPADVFSPPGTHPDSRNPVQVLKATAQPLTSGVMTAGGFQASYCLTSDGSVWAWGKNTNYQLGDGTTTQRDFAIQVKTNATTALSGVTAIAAGDYHLLALKADGTVWAVGYNNYGQIGDGSSTTAPYAVQVKASASVALSDVVSIAATASSSVAVRADGTAWSWGYNGYGQLGDGTGTSASYPVQMKATASTAFAGVQSVAAGRNHILITKSDRSLWALGLNSDGQLGNGTTTNASYPVAVKKDAITPLTSISSAAGGWGHSVAMDSTGVVYTWGYPTRYALGNGASTSPTSTYATAYSGWPGPGYVPTSLSLTAVANSGTNAQSFLLTATVGGSAGDITRVDFYQGSTLLGSVTSGPWELQVTNASANAPFTAVAYNASGPIGVTADATTATGRTFRLPLARAGHSFLFNREGSIFSIAPTSVEVKSVTGVDGTGRFILDPASYLEVKFPATPLANFWLSDESTGEYSQLNAVDLRATNWAIGEPYVSGGSVVASNIRLFLVPVARASHAFSYMLGTGTAFPITLGTEPSVMGINPANSTLESHALGFVIATAYPSDTSSGFRALDLTAFEQPPVDTLDLRSVTWSAIHLPTVMRSANIALSAANDGAVFTLHTSAGTLSTVTAGTVNFASDSYTGTGVSGSVAIGDTFWLTRNADGAESPHVVMGVTNQFVDWRAQFAPMRQTQTTRFHIGANRNGHVFKVYQPDGYKAPLTLVSSNNTLTTWNDNGQALTYYYDAYDADIDTQQTWTLMDETTSTNLGVNTSVLEGWVAGGHTVAPAGSIGININHIRRNHTFRLRQADGTEWNVQLAAGFENPATYQPAQNTVSVGTPVERTATIRYFSATAPYDPAQSFKIIDATTGEEKNFAAGTTTAELTMWGGAPQTLALDIIVTRWNHNLLLMQADGSSFPIVPGNLQGSWWYSTGGPVWFSTYSYFDATTQQRPGLDWWVYDVTANEIAATGQGNLSGWTGPSDNWDADEDDLPDWYEYILGTDPLLADSDDDKIPDGWEVRYGLNPNYDGDAGAISQGGGLTNLEKYNADLNPLVWDTDGDVMDDAYELQHGLDPKDPSDASRNSPGTPLSNLEMYQGYTWQNFALPLGRADHYLYLLVPGGDAGSYSYNFRSLRPAPMSMKPDGNWQLQSDSYLIAQIVYHSNDPIWQSTLVDDTVGEQTPINGYDYRTVPWFHRDPGTPTGLSSNLALPMDRRLHSFAMVGSDGMTYPITIGQEQGESTWDEATSTSTYHSFGFFTGTAYVESGYVVDLTTMEQGELNARDLVVGGWGPINLPSMVRTAYIKVAEADASNAFTLHTSTGSLQGIYPLWMWPQGAPAADYYLMGQVGIGETFWVTRDADVLKSRTKVMLLSDIVADWSSDFGPVRPVQTHTFRVGGDRRGHNLVIHHTDGYTRALEYSSEGVLTTWDQDGQEFNYPYTEYLGRIDNQQSWWLVDETDAATNLGDNYDILPGWQVWNITAPSGYLSVPLAKSRHGHTFKLRQDDGSLWNLKPAPGYEDPAVNLTASQTLYVGTPDERTVSIEYFPALAPYDATQGFTVIDVTAGDEIRFSANPMIVDLSQWYPAPTSLSLNISVVRWTHELVLHQSNGESFPITRGNLQGSWSFGPPNNAWFATYSYFDGNTQFHPEIDWWVYDVTTGESSPLNTSNLINWMGASAHQDSDGDGLPDWYEFIIGTNGNENDANHNGIADWWEQPLFGPAGLQLLLDPSERAALALGSGWNQSPFDPHTGTSNPGGGSTPWGGDPIAPPVAAPNLVVQAATEGGVTDYTTAQLSWGGSDAPSFVIERKTSSGEWITLATIGGNTYEDHGLVANRRYQYRVTARSGPGSSAVSNICNYEVPLALEGLVAWSSSSGWKGGVAFDTDSAGIGHAYLSRTGTYSHDSGEDEVPTTFTYTETLSPAAHKLTKVWRLTTPFYGGVSTTDFSYSLTTPESMGGPSAPQYLFLEHSTMSIHGLGEGEKPERLNSDYSYQSSQSFPAFWWITGQAGPFAGQSTVDSTWAHAVSDPDEDQVTFTYTSSAGQNGTGAWSGSWQSHTPDEDSGVLSGPGWDYAGVPSYPLSWIVGSEYTTSKLIGDVIGTLSAYGDPGSMDTPKTVASRLLSADQMNFAISLGKYSFKANPSYTTSLKWYEVFVPDDNPDTAIDESEENKVVVASHQAQLGQAGQTPDFTVNIGSLQGNGVVRIVMAAQLDVYDRTSDNVALDPSEKTGAGADVPADGSASTEFVVRPTGVSGTKYYLTWNGASFQVYKSGTNEEIFSGAEVEAGSFYIVAKPDAADGDRINMHLSANYNGQDLGSDRFVGVVNLEDKDFTLPVDDASGPRFRKLALNGRPMADEKPQHTAESDQEKEETFIDAMTLGLRHSVTDIFVPVAGSDLVLAARRNAAATVWNMKSGFRPHERRDRPFGAGWSSSLAPTVEIVEASGQPNYVYITDESGTSHRFVAITNGAGGYTYLPFPTSQSENSDHLSRFDGSVFTSRYGTMINFAASGIEVTVATDRERGSATSESHKFLRATSIADRLGNTLAFTYSGNTLIPDTISLVNSATQTLSLRHNAAGLVTEIWDPNGIKTEFTYGAKAYSVNGVNYSVPVLIKVRTADNAATEYDYDLQIENDLTPLKNGETATPKLHLDLASIKDPLGNTYSFTYGFDHTKFNYRNIAGYYPQTGLPRNVSRVTLPDNKHADFSNLSYLAVRYEGTTPRLTTNTIRKNRATDAEGHETTYTWGGAQIVALNELTSLYSDPILAPKIVYFTQMTVDFSGLGTQSYEFDPNAGFALTKSTDFNGHDTVFNYGDNWSAPAAYQQVFWAHGFNGKYSDVTSQTNALGKTKTFEYFGEWRIMNKVTDEKGRVTTNVVDGKGRRKRETISDASGIVQVTEFAYDDVVFPGVVREKRVISQNGDPIWVHDLVTSYQLDANGRVVQETIDPGGLSLSTQSSYDANGNKLTSTDANGKVTYFGYDVRNRLVGIAFPDHTKKTLEYDLRGNKITETDENEHVTRFAYDKLNRLKEQRRVMLGGDLVTGFGYNAVGSRTSVTDPNLHTTTTEFDALQRPTLITDALNHSTEFAYGVNSGANAFDSTGFKATWMKNANDYITFTTNDALYRPTEVSIGYATQKSAVTKTKYDDVGNAIEVTDPLLKVTENSYDALNRLVQVKFADNKLNIVGYTSTGLKWRTVDELGRESNVEYDNAGRPVKAQAPALADLSRATTLTYYDAVGNVTATINPRGKRSDMTYDARNRKVREAGPEMPDPLGGPGTVRALVDTAYDGVGNVIKITDPRNYVTTTEYDAANRKITVTAPAVPVAGENQYKVPITQMVYDAVGNVLEVIDAKGRHTVNTYDAVNRLKTTTVTPAAGHDITVAYDYDAVGNRTKVTDGKLQVTQFGYDGLKRNTTTTNHLGFTTTLGYDGVNKTERLDADGKLTKYKYDARHRLTSVEYWNHASQSEETRSYAYDLAGHLEHVTEPAKGVKADVHYTYDEMYRVVQEISGGVAMNYTYDLAGNRTKTVNFETGLVLDSAYDAMNRMTSLEETPAGGVARQTAYVYDLAGNVVGKELPNGDTIVTSFDALNRSIQIVGQKGGGGMLYHYVQGRDIVGNVLAIAEQMPADPANVPSKYSSLEYDGTDRLLKESVLSAGVPSETTYTYDTANNRATRTKLTDGVASTSTYTYDGGNRLTTVTEAGGTPTATTFEYNNAGSRTVRKVNGVVKSTYGYDTEQRLVSLAQDGHNYAYTYDYRTRRVERNEDTLATKVIFSGGTSVQEKLGGSTTVQYVRGSDWGGGVGGILYTLRNGMPSFTHYDSRGDVTTKTASNGDVTYQASYEAFGTRTQEQGSTSDRQKANTKEEDPGGLLNEGMRYRDLETGEFITADPAGFVDGPNLYAYVRQNPWTKFDPDGLEEMSCMSCHSLPWKERAKVGLPMDQPWFEKKETEKATKLTLGAVALPAVVTAAPEIATAAMTQILFHTARTIAIADTAIVTGVVYNDTGDINQAATNGLLSGASRYLELAPTAPKWFTNLLPGTNRKGIKIDDIKQVSKPSYSGNVDYTVTVDGKLSLGTYHEFLSGGENVTAAGRAFFKSGKLVRLDNWSGHYEPTGVNPSIPESAFTLNGFKADGLYQELPFNK